MVRETDELYEGILNRMFGTNIVKMRKGGLDQLNRSCLEALPEHLSTITFR